MFLFAAACVLLLCSSLAWAEEEFRDQARCYTTWDDSYFYLAFRVDCPDVRSVNTKPNADTAGDDAVEFYIKTDRGESTSVTPNCYSMSVTAGNGSQFRVGNEAGELQRTPVFTFRYSAAIQGTVNNSDDVDMGYTVEIAVPWELLKMKAPQMGDMAIFNVLIRSHGQNGGFVSLSPNVKTEEDVLNPSKWSTIVFAANTFGVATTGREKVMSPRYVVRAPLVDGNIGDKEYHRNTSFALDMPLPEGFVYEAKFPVQRLVFTHYYYWYQADQRKAAPYSHIVGPDGTIQLQDFPAKNIGPWFSYDRVQWHKEELADIVAAGIDVVLPVYWGDKTSRAGFAAKGLDCLVSALQELEQEGKPYPLVAMFFDTTSMTLTYGDKPDLTREDVKRAFYGMIKDFYDRIPFEYRAYAQADKPYAGQAANIVVLRTSECFYGLDSSFIEYCNTRFIQDFGNPLVWVASDDFKDKAEGIDGYCSYGAGLGTNCFMDGRLQICAVGAGFDNSAVSEQGKTLINSRMGGETYEQGWSQVLKNNPHWVICDSWNELHEGSDICASREYGRKYIDITRANVNRFRGGRDFDVQYLRFDVPKVIPPKQFAQAELTIRNIGNSPWRTSEGFAVAYRWYKKGRFHGESKVRRPLGQDVMPGDTITVNVGIATVNAQGTELSEGDWEIRLELIRLSDTKWFSVLGDQPLVIPITIGKPVDWDASYLHCSAPTMLATGQDYPVKVRVRNDGSQTWKKGVVKLGCSLHRISNYTHDSTELSEIVATRDIRALLDKDCKPGEIAEFEIVLNLVGPDGKPLPEWKQDSPWSYQLRFDIYNGEKWLSELGGRTLDQVVGLYEKDYGPRIVDCDISRTLSAGQTVETKVVVRNTGAQAWDRKRTKLGYHWYHLDGSEMLWDGETTPIPTTVQPGWPLMVNAKVTAPQYDGRYALVWDVMVDDQWLSVGPLSRGGDILPVFVEVTGGKLSYLDLSSMCEVGAVSPDTERTIGDFDGKGCSFPTELFPPDVGPGEDVSYVYPTGYKWDCGVQAEGRISFRYPDKAPGAKAAAICKGQKIDVEDGAYVAVHILGASVNGPTSGEISLNYTGSAQAVRVSMSDWVSGPANSEPVGYSIRHRHTHGGDELDKRCYLYTYTLKADAGKTLTSITLPNNPDMRIVAVTLERAAIAAPTEQ